ncbi:Lnp1p KNAG_0M00310 [Huiozyma naganishii CBS 8797]|uniref:Lunapark zinc ribbon domain-containing protein n=1 Tax=Huiozyma naganishii (strain ATCC MYA-139 / BCRC 22969 / CBS 8797 / KCTC 17520 / NBRC 10181 / NCYC 3082 / Yp74L-3) TaxID=1071383 RepID=J7SAM9_HUIN7|nr:hypothetical protein KNAG_0M00310 [Kazachstania naganishii CBS 8797]CCK72884.1 hypothetical protein KNAG_0M00310 [Kazachstania naganishii CBS 8797]
MIRTLFGSRKGVVQRYTEDLVRIAAQIEDVEQQLKSLDRRVSRWRRSVSSYGASLTALYASYMYYTSGAQWMLALAALLAGTLVLVLYNLGMRSGAGWIRSYKMRRLAQLRGKHESTVDKLKEETQFNATSSLLQRFQNGDDALQVVDTELSLKYDELQQLKDELTQLQTGKQQATKEQNDVWFDKVIGLLAGGNDVQGMPHIEKVVCPECDRFAGLYRLPKGDWQYMCPFCNHRTPSHDVEGATAEEETE